MSGAAHDPALPETEHLRLQRLLALSIACHAVLAEASSEQALRDNYCQRLVAIGGYASATAARKLAGNGALPILPTPESCVSVVLPLESHSQNFGSLIIATRQGELADDEQGLLQVLAANLATGLHALVSSYEHQHIVGELSKLSHVIEQSPIAVVVTDLQGSIEYCNLRFCEVSGYTRDELIGGKLSILKSGLTPDSVYAELWTTITGGKEWRGEILNRKKSGEFFWERLRIAPLKDETGVVQNYVAMKEDISELKHVSMNLHLRERALESSSNGIMITSVAHLEHPITYVNPAFERITGYAASEVIGKNGRFLVRDDLNQKGLAEIRSALRERREGHAVLRNYRKDGALFWNELHIAPVLDEDGKVTTHFISILNNVTERVQYEEQLQFQATHDVLTGLANRSLLSDRINQGIVRARRDQDIVGVMLIDLDRFKVVNDGLGHASGDMLLREIARRLKSCVRDTDTVARLGGDEFVVVLNNVIGEDNVAAIASKILKAVHQPLHIEDKKLIVTASIGVSMFPRDGDDGDLLLRNADLAMYRVKEYGRNNYRFYLPEMHGMAIDRLDMEADLRRALDADELVVFYQPKVDIVSGCIVGAEALVRWIHPKIGMINPLEFIPLAEETGLIIPVGETVLRKVAGQLRAWCDEGLTVVPVAVNISPRQFRQENLASTIRRILKNAGIAGEMLDLELTESMVMVHAEAAAAVLRELKTLGCRLYLDDFGTGYSSLAYLKRFPIDALKIDRSFILDLTSDSDDAAIAGAIIAMAHSLGMRVVAEGVEHREQLAVLKEHGCDEFQGYYFARPIPVEKFTAMLRDGTTLNNI
ncbi:MAG: EAL domain-containing protein [Rhodocyclaceae bacterium]|nr:EAL domain-containing protein [Rhodocyclaceae bacterium]